MFPTGVEKTLVLRVPVGDPRGDSIVVTSVPGCGSVAIKFGVEPFP